MLKICSDDSCLNHLTNTPVCFTRKSSYIYAFWEITYQKYYVFCWQGVRTHLTQLVSLCHCCHQPGDLSEFTVRLLWHASPSMYINIYTAWSPCVCVQTSWFILPVSSWSTCFTVIPFHTCQFSSPALSPCSSFITPSLVHSRWP